MGVVLSHVRFGVAILGQYIVCVRQDNVARVVDTITKRRGGALRQTSLPRGEISILGWKKRDFHFDVLELRKVLCMPFIVFMADCWFIKCYS